MRKLFSAVAGLILAVALTSVGAKASPSGTVGCGGTGQVACSGSFSVTDGVYTGSASVQITSFTGISSSFLSANPYVAGVLDGSPLTMSFDTSVPDITFSNIVGGVGDFALDAEITSFTVNAAADSLKFDFSVFAIAVELGNPACGASCFNTFDDNITGVNGTLTVDYSGDPAITGVTGTVGLPFSTGGGGGTTPEPGTLLLLGSGLLGFAPLIRRKLARA